MKKLFLSLSVLLGTMVLLSACSGNDDLQAGSSSRTWTAVVKDAVKGTPTTVDTETRALFIGGHTNRYGILWDNGDVVQVYNKDGVKVEGQLTPDKASWGTKSATLTGTLTGSFAVNDELTLYQPGMAMDFTGQTGTLQSASDKTYQSGTVTVEAAQANELTLSNVQLNYLMYYIRFLLLDDDTKERLHPSRLELHAVSGGDIVLTADEDGNVTTGDLVVNMAEVDGECPGEVYVALMNKDYARVSYELVATVGDDIYVGPITSKIGSGYGSYSPNFGVRGELRECFRYMKKMSASAGYVESATVGSFQCAKVYTSATSGYYITCTDYPSTGSTVTWSTACGYSESQGGQTFKCGSQDEWEAIMSACDGTGFNCINSKCSSVTGWTDMSGGYWTSTLSTQYSSGNRACTIHGGGWGTLSYYNSHNVRLVSAF